MTWITLTLSLLVQVASADPCGLVPPVRLLVDDERPIERIGVQQTYVFYREGVQTIAIRPGFEGRASEFGMLVPLPAAPSIQKIPDELFDHLATALEPPEVHLTVAKQQRSVVLTREFLSRLPTGRSYQSAVGLSAGVTGGVSRHWIEVVSEEAIGSYEVAVLEAGSPLALRRWMDAHDYAYPLGMESAVEGYVDRGWVFVVVKARLGRMAGVQPMPGQRSVDGSVPEDAPFSGFVQGMAFRFFAEEPVVPMRLSTFNGAHLHNRMFVFADEPVRVAELPERFVRAQIPAEELGRALHEPLAIRVRGPGSLWSLSDQDLARVDQARDPGQITWAIADRLRADLFAAASSQLALGQEALTTRLINIGFALGAKGPAIEALARAALRGGADPRAELDLLEGMTLTVVEGDFDPEILRNNDLHFEAWTLPPERRGAIAGDPPAPIALTAWIQ